ncbi:porin family protein [Ichthyenterobacterium magnum]|nr:porin family protein [Ichthyenterobacterium magnum]
MKYCLFSILLCICLQQGFAQNDDKTLIDTASVDDKYREDQFYASITYNLLGQKPDGVSQNGFSSGFHFGFIRDMPINERRNLALGLGIGVSTNSYNQTLLITKNNTNNFEYTVLDDNETSFSKNKFTTYVLELPFEFRWRTSTATEYNFWRIYTGFKLGYVVLNTSKFQGDLGHFKYSNIGDFNKLQYGFTFSAGYSNISFHVYYGLNNIFKDSVKVNGQDVGMQSIKVGLMFYIL